VFEDRVLTRIFGPKSEEVAGGWRKLHNEELHNLHTSLNIIRVIKSRRMRNVYKTLVRNPELIRSLGRSRRKWEDNIRTDLREVGWEGVDWIHMAQDRDQWWAVVNSTMNLRVP
jgi:hypothetical protein